MATGARIPPIQCLLTFEALARLRSVTQSAEELCVTPREGLATLQKFPGAAGQSASADKRKLRLAVTPTFARAWAF